MERERSSVRISKMLSLMLRHRPEEFDIEVDRYGFADVQDVLAAMQEEYGAIEMADIEAVVYDSGKQRFEIVEGRIRARYGHSFPMELGIAPAEPPEFLYKGFDAREVNLVLQEGLKPTDRQYVHLSFDAEVAAQLGSGRRRVPAAVVRVEAVRAHQAGVVFYDCGPTVLTTEVPADFLVLESSAAPPERPMAAPSSDLVEPAPPAGPVSFGRKRKFRSRK